MNPKISIITITFNSEKTVEETIKSVLSQNYDNLEYIIIDGASKDGTMDIVNKYRDKIDYVVSEPDKGISDAFNKGIAVATGDIIGIINSDDQYLPNALRIISNNYKRDIDIYISDMIIHNLTTGVKNRATPSLTYEPTCRRTTVCHPSTFITRVAYSKYGVYKTHFKYMMDQDILTRMYLGGAKFLYISESLATFTLGGISDNVPLRGENLEYKQYLTDNGVSGFALYLTLFRSIIMHLLKDTLIKFNLFNFFRNKKYAVCNEKCP